MSVRDDAPSPGPLYDGARAEVQKHESVYLRVRLSQKQYATLHRALVGLRDGLDAGDLRNAMTRLLDQVPVPK